LDQRSAIGVVFLFVEESTVGTGTFHVHEVLLFSLPGLDISRSGSVRSRHIYLWNVYQEKIDVGADHSAV